MYFILVTVEKQMIPTRQFSDNGAGKEAVLKEAMQAFKDECEDAQHSANTLKKDVTVELVSFETHKPLVYQTLSPTLDKLC